MFKNFFIWLIKSLIMLLLATLLFSSITLDLPSLIKGVFGDIFSYASLEIQNQVVIQLAETCSALDQGTNVVTLPQICNNQSLIDSMRNDCRNFIKLKSQGAIFDNEAKLIENCKQFESGEIEKTCSQMKQKNSMTPDLSNIGTVCKSYKEGKINDKEFFFSVIGGAFPSQLELSQTKVLEKYNSVINYLNRNKFLYIIGLLILLSLLYFLIRDVQFFIVVLIQISFGIGVLIMLPYILIIAYDKLVGIDTSAILGTFIGAKAIFDAKAIISVILLLFLRTYNSFIITTGAIFLAAGVVGKVYRFKLQKKIPEQTSKKKENVTELLDELEENAKKKTKEK